MSAEWNIVVPPRKDDEEDCTEKQINFIRDLFREIGPEGLPELDIKSLGKWQASSLIVQLIEIKDNRLESSSFIGIAEDSIGKRILKKAKKVLIITFLVLAVFVVFVIATADKIPN